MRLAVSPYACLRQYQRQVRPKRRSIFHRLLTPRKHSVDQGHSDEERSTRCHIASASPPKDLNHETRQCSCVGSEIEWAKLWAESQDDARWRVARATDVSAVPKEQGKGKYHKLVDLASPWELPDVTFCEPDRSDSPLGDGIIFSNGIHLPFKF